MIATNEFHEEQFQGWYIEEYIFDAFRDKEISAKELILLAEIDSLTDIDCSQVTNNYLAKLLHIGTSRISQMLSKLKHLNFIVQEGTNGKKRNLFINQDYFPENDNPCSIPDGVTDEEYFSNLITGRWIPKLVVISFESNQITAKELILSAEIAGMQKCCPESFLDLSKILRVEKKQVEKMFINLCDVGLIWAVKDAQKEYIFRSSCKCGGV